MISIKKSFKFLLYIIGFNLRFTSFLFLFVLYFKNELVNTIGVTFFPNGIWDLITELIDSTLLLVNDKYFSILFSIYVLFISSFSKPNYNLS